MANTKLPMGGYVVTANGNLIGDEFLMELWAKKFVVKLFVNGDEKQAGLHDETGEGRVPDALNIWTFANRQDRYTKELKLRTPVLKRGGRKGR